MRKLRNSKSVSLLPLLFAVVAAIGMLLGYRMSKGENFSPFVITGNNDSSGQIGRVEEILRFIESQYVDEVDQNKLVDAAIYAILDELDPHSVYISEVELQSVKDKMNGSYKGLGIETILFNDTLTIVKVLEDSPAQNAGLRYGDQILSINDSIIAGNDIPVEVLQDMLQTDSTDYVDLTLHTLNGDNQEITIKFDHIKIPNVTYYQLQNDISYIDIHRFSDRTSDDVIRALEYFQKDKIIDKLIIDLRDNPGGYLPEATKILNQLFIENERILVYTEGENSRKTEYKSTGRPFYQINKIAILINNNSASASEIIAGALQDWDKAVVIGQNSYGKGLVQEQFSLRNGGALRLTTARYFTPTGRYIQAPFQSDVFEKDTSLDYSSKLLQRNLTNDGGITPDIQIRKGITEELIDFQVNELAALEAFRLIRKAWKQFNFSNHLYIPTHEDLDESIQNITQILEKYFNKELLPSSNEVALVIKEQVARQLPNDAQMIYFLETEDQFVRAADNALLQKNIFAESTDASE